MQRFFSFNWPDYNLKNGICEDEEMMCGFVTLDSHGNLSDEDIDALDETLIGILGESYYNVYEYYFNTDQGLQQFEPAVEIDILPEEIPGVIQACISEVRTSLLAAGWVEK